ncbi:hypothetical protein KAR63_06080 [Weissella uvarum]|nr:AbiH family protein [Weissella uvarum]MCM0595759.1 hypothetical protein [Weissella uvarum]
MWISAYLESHNHISNEEIDEIEEYYNDAIDAFMQNFGEVRDSFFNDLGSNLLHRLIHDIVAYQFQQNENFNLDTKKLFRLIKCFLHQSKFNSSDEGTNLEFQMFSDKVRILSNNKQIKWTEEIRKDYFPLDNYFERELRIFEKDFKAYIIEQVKDNSVYEDRSNALLTVLAGDISWPDYVEVFSFNYTLPKSKRIANLRNLHGNIKDENEIIFGIDNDSVFESESYASTEYSSSKIREHLLPYTKTYRNLSSTNDDDFSNKIAELEYIKVFGHSLSKADYAYYQSLFDANNLYDSDVKLIFYYYDHSATSGQSLDDIKNSFFKRVTNLITAYGESMPSAIQGKDNQQGRNLMHKLEMENRIKIKELKEEEIEAAIKNRANSDAKIEAEIRGEQLVESGIMPRNSQ